MSGRTPSGHEWQQIQGGEPIILRSPSGNLFEIIHAYKTEDNEYTGPMAIVPTPAQQLANTTNLNYLVEGGDPGGVTVPSALLWEHHGKPCQARSDTPYDTVGSDRVEDYIEHKLRSGWARFALKGQVEKPQLIHIPKQ